MQTQYLCGSNTRRLLVRKSGHLNGIDFLEVSPDDQSVLFIHFLHPLPGETGGVPASADPLRKENIRIEGGIRLTDINIKTIVNTDSKVLTVKTSQTGDFSDYTLRLVASPVNNEPPSGYDPQLSLISFSFKANCQSYFDCAPDHTCPPEPRTEPQIDYLAKDYASFRRLMLDRLSLLLPDWTERNTADLQIALVELLAYAGDHLSYYQDAVGTEAYLFKARKRISVRRHARLLDYHVHNGCNARVWVHIAVTKGGNLDGGELASGEVLLTRSAGQETVITEVEFGRMRSEKSLTLFETKHPVTLHSAHNEINFYTWANSECCLPAGSTRATLVAPLGAPCREGQILIFEELLSPTTGRATDADPRHRHVVRLTEAVSKQDIVTGTDIIDVAWAAADALPFALCLSTVRNGVSYQNISVARGNIVLADHGGTLKSQAVSPASFTGMGAYRPRLPHQDITVSELYNHELAVKLPATGLLEQNPRQAIPNIELQDGEGVWTARRDLLRSDRFANDFVAEIEADHSIQLRFGNDILGRQPGQGFKPLATYRIGNGPAGNVGAEAIGCIVKAGGGIQQVRNPLPATGGTTPETMEEVRQFAPEAFKIQERAVTAADYAAKAELHPEVQRAVAHFRWTGSWYTVFIAIDRKAGLAVDDKFKQDIYRHLDEYRLAGYDLEIRSPLFVPLEIAVNVCVKRGYFKSQVQARLQQLFSRFNLADGGRAFFHPDNFTFGQPLYLSAVYQQAMRVTGVESVEVRTFHRLGRPPDQEKETGVLQPGRDEIIRLDNDPNYPENGKITFLMAGGL